MTCPECGGAKLEYRQREGRTSDGELWREEYWVCGACKVVYTAEELDAIASGLD